MEHLYIWDSFLPPRWQDDIEDGQWLEVLHPFTNVKFLYISRELTPFIAHALQELVGERVIEVLPALQILFLGVAPVGTCPGSHWEVRRRATARRSPCNSFSLGWEDEFSVTRGRRLISSLYFLSQLRLISSTYQSPFFLVFLTRS